jgi:BlaI family penicillinase repressor
MSAKSNSPSNLELQVLSVLWEDSPATVREVLAKLPDGKERAYTTVLTVMQNMEKKGLLSREPRGNAHVYSPTESKRQTLRPMMRGLLQNVFGGRVSTVMQHLLEDAEVSDDELGEIRRLVDARCKSKKGGNK